jgi:hypothetical protein
MASIDSNSGDLLFIHSAGGCGKTFLCNTIAATVRARGQVALCVASSGIAALLLDGGRTAHSRFKIPIQIDETSIAAIKCQNQLHQILEETKVIIWDEVSMQHRFAIEAVDRALRDLFEVSTALFSSNKSLMISLEGKLTLWRNHYHFWRRLPSDSPCGPRWIKTGHHWSSFLLKHQHHHPSLTNQHETRGRKC